MPQGAQRWPQNSNRDTPRLRFPVSHRKQTADLISNRDSAAWSPRTPHRPPVPGHQPRFAALIATVAIRKRRNRGRINNLKISNRHKTASFLWSAAALRRLSTAATLYMLMVSTPGCSPHNS
jgi:hypothetical protein